MNMPTQTREDEAKELAEHYAATLFNEGEVCVEGKHHQWHEVIDEDLDNILALQRTLHRSNNIAFKVAATALKDAQVAVVNDWATRIGREQMGLSC